jgi:hypothetical protein
MAAVRDWWTSRPEPAASLPVWLGLFVAALLLLGTGTPAVPVTASLMLVVTTLLISLRWRVAAIAVLVLLALGLWLRIAAVGGGYSDVLTVTQAAIRAVQAGANPYGVGFPESQPPGAPFAYGPLALLWYVPALAQPARMELVVGCLTLIVLAARGHVLGLGIYAVLPALLVTANDGSNDTSAGLLLLVALLVAQRAPIAGGFLLGLAGAFKPYALAWLPPLLAYGGIVLPLLAFLAGSLLVWGPALLFWGPSAILDSFRRADAIHERSYYSLAWVLGGSATQPAAVWQTVRWVIGAIVAIGGFFLVRSARSFVVVGIAVYLATLYTGWWSTFAYVAAIAPIVCWHLDDWLGIGAGRVRWPGDPIGQLTRWVDARWPVRRPWQAVDVSSTA